MSYPKPALYITENGDFATNVPTFVSKNIYDYS